MVSAHFLLSSSCLFLLQQSLASSEGSAGFPPALLVTPTREAQGGPWQRHEQVPWSLRLPLVRTSPVATNGVTITAIQASGSIVKAFQRIEFQVALDQVISRPYETDPTLGGLDLQATLTAPSGAIWQIAGFYDGSTTPGIWKVRFCPDEISSTSWQVLITARSSSSTSSLTSGFLCQGLSSGVINHGWARIHTTGLQFSYDGSWFWGLGHNTGWQSQVESPSASVMAAHGENLLSFWMAEPWELQVTDGNPAHTVLPSRAPLETANIGIGIYNQDACSYLDGVVADAEAAGIYLVPTLWAHDEAQDAAAPFGNGSWSNNAYSLICSSPTDFFTIQDVSGQPTPSWHYQQNRYRYIAARWACSPAIIGWVGMDEIDGTVGASLSQSQSWCLGMRQALSSWDPYRTASSGAYPLVVTKTDTTSSDAMTWAAFLDLKACDSYMSDASTAAISSTITGETATMLSLGKPCFHGEFGAALTAGDAATVSQPDHLRHGIMAALTAGASWSPLLWTDGGQFPLVGDGSSLGSSLLSQFQFIANFTANLPMLGDPTLQPLSVTFSTSSVKGQGRIRTDATAGFLWLYANSSLSLLSHPRLTISSVAAGNFAISWYDVTSGNSIPLQTVSTIAVPLGLQTTNTLSLDLPASSSSDLALQFFLQGATTASSTGTNGTSSGTTSGTSTSNTTAGSTSTSGTSSGTSSSNGGSMSSSGSHCGLGVAGMSFLLLIYWRNRRLRS